MGWSCSEDAARTLDVWSRYCVEVTDSSNTFRVNGREYFYEVDTGTEHADGAVTGKIMAIEGLGHCRTFTSFRVEPNGEVLTSHETVLDTFHRFATRGHRTLKRTP